jgi:hypothetical protein
MLWKKVAKNCGIFHLSKTAQSKQSLIGRKFAQSGHPVAFINASACEKKLRSKDILLVFNFFRISVLMAARRLAVPGEFF